MSGDLPVFRIDLTAAAGAMARGELTSAALVEACLARAAAVEGWLHAFAHLDPERARGLAAAADRRRHQPDAPPLLGIPVGVKDIVDTAGVATEHGSTIFAGRVPERSADAVLALERAGALVFGKTVTTEVAYFHPGPTTNPWNRSRTPGGSSMGSAAAVAAGIIPAAVGSQTNGSVIRPAAFCGVVGFKPSAGRLPRRGMLTFSQTLDQVGAFARSVPGVGWLAAAMAGDPPPAWLPDVRGTSDTPAPLLAAVPTGEWERADPAMQARFEADVAALAAAGARIERPGEGWLRGGEHKIPAGFRDVLAVHRTIMAAEGAAAIGPLVAGHTEGGRPPVVSATLQTILDEGARIPAETYRAALRERERLIAAFATWAAPFDAILTPPAVGEAPGPETTGDPRFCTRWTLVGAPALVLPTGLGPAGLPLGLQLVGAPGADSRLLTTAAWVESRHPATPYFRADRP